MALSYHNNNNNNNKISEQQDRGQPITKSRNSEGSTSKTESNKNPTKNSNCKDLKNEILVLEYRQVAPCENCRELICFYCLGYLEKFF